MYSNYCGILCVAAGISGNKADRESAGKEKKQVKTITEITRQKPAPPQIRLAAYCRVSSDSSDQLHSFAAQIKYYSEYCKQHPEYKFVDIYADEGITGTSMEKRDDFRRMLRDCKKGLIDRIIVKSMSRFARNTEEMLTALQALEQMEVSVYFEEQGLDTKSMNSEMFTDRFCPPFRANHIESLFSVYAEPDNAYHRRDRIADTGSNGSSGQSPIKFTHEQPVQRDVQNAA